MPNAVKKFTMLALLLAALGLLLYASAPTDPQICGATGYSFDPKAKRDFLSELGKDKYLADVNPAIYGADQGESFLWRPVDAVVGKPGHFPLDQSNIGSCVGFGFGGACDCLLAQQVVLGQSLKFVPCVEESIYAGARVEAPGVSYAGYWQGANCSYAAKWLKTGGMLFRENHPELGLDLTVYSVSRCSEWGAYGQGGKDKTIKQKLIALAKNHPIRQIAAVRTPREAAAAVKAGYPVVFGGNYWADGSRDANGFARVVWHKGGHCQFLIGYRDSNNLEGLCSQNSWGKYNGGGKYPADQPDGSYWVTMRDAQLLLGDEAYALADAVGFPIKDISKLNRDPAGW